MAYSHTWTEPRPEDLDAILSSYETPAFWGKGSVMDEEFDGEAERVERVPYGMGGGL